jgi:hypothetical protein
MIGFVTVPHLWCFLTFRRRPSIHSQALRPPPSAASGYRPAPAPAAAAAPVPAHLQEFEFPDVDPFASPDKGQGGCSRHARGTGSAAVMCSSVTLLLGRGCPTTLHDYTHLNDAGTERLVC